MDWQALKIMLAGTTGISQDALHALAGVCLQLFLAAAMRRKVTDWIPWLLVAALALVNEWVDLTTEIWPVREKQWGESMKDMLVTMALPTLLLLATRFAPGLFTRPVPGEEGEAA